VSVAVWVLASNDPQRLRDITFWLRFGMCRMEMLRFRSEWHRLMMVMSNGFSVMVQWNNVLSW
jgi:hypothetical protein